MRLRILRLQTLTECPAVCSGGIVGALIIMLLLSFSIPARGEQLTSSSANVLGAFDAAFERVAAASAIGGGQRESLKQKLSNALAAYRRDEPCTTVNILDAYLNETQALRRGSITELAEQLYGIGRFLRAEVLRGVPSGAQCERHESFGREPAVAVVNSDNTRLAGRISLGEAAMWPTSGGGAQFTKVTIPGVSFIGQPGLPGVPIVRRLIAVPRGATARVYAANPTIAETVQLNVYPFQQSPGDQTEPIGFDDPPFVKNAEAYASHGPFPSSVCTVTILGQMRDLTTAQLACAAGSYDPAENVLTMFSHVEFDVRFEGGDGYFVTQAALNPFEPPVLDPEHVKLFVNWPEILKHVDYSQYEPKCYGEELLIFTPLDLKVAADKLAQWKKEKGILTSVVLLNDETGTFPLISSAEDINWYIKYRYEYCTVRPSYILLFGDAERVPTWYLTTTYSTKTASDYLYAAPSGTGVSPSFAVGRIPVDDSEQAEQVVAKIIAYEKNPPADATFYKNASILAQFQCCRYDGLHSSQGELWHGWDQRTFVENAEFARNVLLGHGYTAERIYTKENDYHYDFGDVAKKYKDGTPLPSDLAPESGFVWIESGSNDAKNHVVAAFNAGRFLVLQRDHGSWNGWASWQFSRGDVYGLTNGTLLPVVFSMSCSTAFFDNETNPGQLRVLDNYNPYPSTANPLLGTGPGTVDETYFAERLVRHPYGGAIGLIGASRDSSSWPNDVLTKGIFDAVWPDAIPGFGGNTATRRLGDILNHGKKYLLTQQGIDEGWETFWRDELYLYNVIGDPTLAMWTAQPIFLVVDYAIVALLPHMLKLRYGDDGATITAFQDAEDGMVPIGRVVVKDGEATLEYVVPPRDGLPILFSVSKANAISRLLTLPGGGDAR